MPRNWLDRLGGFLRRAARGSAVNVSAQRQAEVDIRAGQEAERQGRLDEACARYRMAVEHAPEYAAAHLNLGIGLEALGDTEGALRSLEAALALEPANAYASYNLGRILYLRGDPGAAERHFRRALGHRPEFPEANLALAHACQAMGDPKAALMALELALAQKPHDFGCLMTFAALAQETGRLTDAEAALRRAIAADRAAQGARSLLAKVLVEQGRLEDALACLNEAVSLHPHSADLRLNLGNVHHEAARIDDAMRCYRDAIRLDPAMSDAHRNLANLLRDQGGHEEALVHYRRALELDPGSAVLRWCHAIAQIPLVYADDREPARCRDAFARELGELEQWFTPERIVEGSDAVGVLQPFYLAYQEQDNRALLGRYGALCGRVMGEWFGRQPFERGRSAPADGRLRVGIVSKYFHDHSVWNAIVKDWFASLDRTRFSIFALYLGTQEDAETSYARSCATRFEMGARGFRQWVQLILDLQPDLLLYPEIGMDPLTAKLSSLRLAPVQAATWGHPETTGLPTIDYFISASDLEPAQAPQAYTEELVLLPNLGCRWRGARVAPDPSAIAGSLPDAGIRLLLCPGMPFKYAPDFDWVFPEIARRLGTCRFLFFSPRHGGLAARLQQRLAAAFRSANLEWDAFVTLLPWQSRPGYYALLGRADVFLDTIGFSGFNTAMDAVHCGLPVVTRKGRFLRGRLAAGILERIGLGELVAESEDEYVALAVRICRDVGYREQLRRRLIAGAPVLSEDVEPIRALERFIAGACAKAAR